MGWVYLSTAWSKNGNQYTALKLAYHFNNIIGIQRSHKIPSKTHALLPYLKDLTLLGKKALGVKVMDSDQLNNAY